MNNIEFISTKHELAQLNTHIYTQKPQEEEEDSVQWNWVMIIIIIIVGAITFTVRKNDCHSSCSVTNLDVL